MARLICISGVGGKLPAAFLLETGDKRILFDLGEGPQPGVLPDMTGVGPVDALCLSHAHVDHAGALQLCASIGNPAIYATRKTFESLPPGTMTSDRHRIIATRGMVDIAGLPFTVGRSGHAPGGVWFHSALDGGFLYMGDWSVESSLLPFDPPPPAQCLITDASYGDRDDSLSGQIDAVMDVARAGVVIAVPSAGRGPDVALALSQRGLTVRACPAVLGEITLLSEDQDHLIEPDKRAALVDLLRKVDRTSPFAPQDVIVATEANAESGLASALLARRDEGFRFVFGSHVPADMPSTALIESGEAKWFGWNVHPRLVDTLKLVRETKAKYVVPAFAPESSMPKLLAAIKPALVLQRNLTFSTTGMAA